MGPDVKNVFNKLSEDKLDLSSQKIELAISDEMRKKVNQIIKLADDAVADANKVEQAFKRVKAANDKRQQQARALRKEISMELIRVSRMSKELGMDLPPQFDEFDDRAAREVGRIPTSNQGNVFPF